MGVVVIVGLAWLLDQLGIEKLLRVLVLIIFIVFIVVILGSAAHGSDDLLRLGLLLCCR